MTQCVIVVKHYFLDRCGSHPVLMRGEREAVTQATRALPGTVLMQQGRILY